MVRLLVETSVDCLRQPSCTAALLLLSYASELPAVAAAAAAAIIQVLGEVGALPDVYSELEVNFFLLRRLLGVRSKEGEKAGKVSRGVLKLGYCGEGLCLSVLLLISLLAGVCSQEGETAGKMRCAVQWVSWLGCVLLLCCATH
jgi:hypothetical protein